MDSVFLSRRVVEFYDKNILQNRLIGYISVNLYTIQQISWRWVCFFWGGGGLQ